MKQSIAGFMILLLSSLCIGQNVSYEPLIEQTFITWMIINVDYFITGEQTTGKGFWAKSVNESKQIVNISLVDNSSYIRSGVEQNIYELQRCDLNMTYQISMKEDGQGCVGVSKCEMFDLWSWMKNAKYMGQQKFINQLVDVWEGEIANYTTGMLGVNPSYPSVPVIYQEKDTKFGIAITAFFVDFLSIQPSKDLFDVPDQCNSIGRKCDTKFTKLPLQIFRHN
jgi:hypothetical protein